MLQCSVCLTLVLARKIIISKNQRMLYHPNADWKPERNVHIITKHAPTCAGFLCRARLPIAIQPKKDRGTQMYMQSLPDKKHYKISWSAIILEYTRKINETFNSEYCCCLIVQIWVMFKFEKQWRMLMGLVYISYLDRSVPKHSRFIFYIKLYIICYCNYQ